MSAILVIDGSDAILFFIGFIDDYITFLEPHYSTIIRAQIFTFIS